MNLTKTTFIIAGISFTIGTLFFITQLIFPEWITVTIVGFYYLVIAVIFNLIVFTLLLGNLIISEAKLEAFKAIGILLSNIPIAFAYAYILFTYILI